MNKSPLPALFLATPVLQSSDRYSVAWLAAASHGGVLPWMVVAPVENGAFGVPDSALQTTSQSTEYGAAASSRRRWVVRSEQRQPEYEFHIRVAYSDTLRIWHEVERLGVDEDHCTVAPLGDTTAMVVYAGASGLQYAILDGSRWTKTGNIDRRPFNAAHPRLRLRPSGGFWLFWAGSDWMHISSYRDGAWARGDSVRCTGAPGETFSPAFLDAEMDTLEYPSVAWTNGGYDQTLRDVTAIAFGNDHGWDPGEEVPNSELSGWLDPTLMHDINQDLWLMWRRASEGTNRWIHTFCSATTAAPSVTANGSGTRLTWALTSRAPRSRWTLERARGDAEFDSIATVRAGEDSLLTFDDPGAAAGTTWRYRVKRECLDVRYVWRSEASSIWRPDTREAIRLTLANPASARFALQLSGASGTFDVRLYDLQGRLAHRQQFAAGGTGEDSVTLDLGTTNAKTSGIYFLRVTDSTGRVSRTARVAIVR